jgi:prepilin-type N-terminal cleavage/methylation domain-containing protein
MNKGFTLIETLVAITLLALAIVAPMTLTTQSLSSAYYARDQMTAFHLAQEAIESVRAARDENILQGAADLLEGIPDQNVPFVIDTRDNTMVECDQGNPPQCPFLRVPTSPTDRAFYAYGPVGTTNIYTDQPGWVSTRFRRTITAEMIPGSSDEMKITVIVSWQTGTFQLRNVTMRENLFRWITTN